MLCSFKYFGQCIIHNGGIDRLLWKLHLLLITFYFSTNFDQICIKIVWEKMPVFSDTFKFWCALCRHFLHFYTLFWKKCISRSAGFIRNQLIRIQFYLVCSKRDMCYSQIWHIYLLKLFDKMPAFSTIFQHIYYFFISLYCFQIFSNITCNRCCLVQVPGL